MTHETFKRRHATRKGLLKLRRRRKAAMLRKQEHDQKILAKKRMTAVRAHLVKKHVDNFFTSRDTKPAKKPGLLKRAVGFLKGNSKKTP